MPKGMARNEGLIEQMRWPASMVGMAVTMLEDVANTVIVSNSTTRANMKSVRSRTETK